MTRIEGTDRKGQRALPVMKRNRTTKDHGFMCNPRGHDEHKPEFARYFATIDEAADFLTANPSWGVWLKAGRDPAGLYFNFLLDGVAR